MVVHLAPSCDTALMLNFHKIFREALQYATGLDVDDKLAAELSDLSESDLVGCPDHGSKAWHKEETRKARKVLAWMSDHASNALLLGYLTICGSTMRLHYTLFKRAQMAPHGNHRSLILELCNPQRSVAAKVLVQ